MRSTLPQLLYLIVTDGREKLKRFRVLVLCRVVIDSLLLSAPRSLIYISNLNLKHRHFIFSSLFCASCFLVLLAHAHSHQQIDKIIDLLAIAMASDEGMTILSSSMQEDEYDDTDDGYEHHPQPHNLSRLSMCTRSIDTNDDDDDDDDDEGMRMFMSRLSIESFDGDADEELSDDKEFEGLAELSSDSDKEQDCYSLPATPPRRRTRGGSISQQLTMVKDYASENEANKGLLRQKVRRNLRRRRIIREKWVESKLVNKKDDQESVVNYVNNNGFSGESEGGGCAGAGLVVITRPKGGRRSLCMDMEEMKACRDLGFELEHERMMEIPSRVSLSGSTLDTSSGGNSPIANWRISSPGDDPRDVKARLKVWAQAVALASASQHSA